MYHPQHSDFRTRKQFPLHLVLGQNAGFQFAKYVALRNASTVCSKQIDPTGKALSHTIRHVRGVIKHGSTVPFPQPRLRSRSPGRTETCWCFWPHPAALPLHPSYWPDTHTHIRENNNNNSVFIIIMKTIFLTEHLIYPIYQKSEINKFFH